jgi:hypothetical protein
MLQWDNPFHIIESSNDIFYKVDLLGEYSVSVTFNVFNISLFDVGDDLKMNSFNERERER